MESFLALGSVGGSVLSVSRNGTKTFTETMLLTAEDSVGSVEETTGEVLNQVGSVTPAADSCRRPYRMCYLDHWHTA